MQKGLVSVLCLSMNHEKYVEQGFTSILAQTYLNFEILYVDNNSADRTFEIADQLFKQSQLPYKGFKRTENYGISANLNFLLKEAKGEYIAVLSADDWWENDNLLLKVKCFIDKPEYGSIYSNGYKYYELEKRQHLFYEYTQKSGDLLDDLLKGNFFYATSVITRHEALKEIGLFDESMLIEDWDMHIRMAMKYKIGYIHNPICYVRVGGGNISLNLKFMDKGYGAYFKKYKNYAQMKQAKKNIKTAHAYQVAHYSPNFKSLIYILQNVQFSFKYFKQIVRCVLGMLSVKR